jgi:hypothetical protein
VSDNEENIRSRETFVIYRRQGMFSSLSDTARIPPCTPKCAGLGRRVSRTATDTPLDTRRPNPAHFGVQGGILAVSDNEENIRSRETLSISSVPIRIYND